MVAIAVFALLAAINLASSAPGPLVKTALGQIEGRLGVSRGGRPYEAWTSVPYAQPPIGKKRFQNPQPPTPWNTTLKAVDDAPACMQKLRIPAAWLKGAKEPTEDCLYLSIYRPKLAEQVSLPVLVYIHGGAFTGGLVGGKNSADYLMDEDVILVQVNYRLNAFGFMSLGDASITGNMGLKDQAQALKWISKNIAAFGGNPKSVTVFGEAAGGASAQYLLKSPLSQNMVSKIATHSGTINHVTGMLPTDFVVDNTKYVANTFGCLKEDNKATLRCLQNVNATDLLEAALDLSSDPLQLSFAPIIEPASIKKPFAAEDLSLVTSKKPWLNTFTNGEYQQYSYLLSSQPEYLQAAYKDVTGYLEKWLAVFIEDKNEIKEAASKLKESYFSAPLSQKRFLTQLAKLHADQSVIYPAFYNIKQHNGPMWLGVLEYSSRLSPKSPNLFTAGNGAQVGFYFKDNDDFAVEPPGFLGISERAVKYLVNFACFDDPTPPGMPTTWRQFESNEILRINRNNDNMADPELFDSYQRIADLWNLIIGWQ